MKFKRETRSIVLIFLAVSMLVFSGCAYYNYLYNAKKSYKEAEEKRREQGEEDDDRSRRSRRNSGSKDYERVIESAGRMLEFYPDSRWEEEALLLIAKAYYRTDAFRKAIIKVQELTGKYPNTEYREEANLWAGMSLLQLSQPDSARTILLNIIGTSKNKAFVARANMALGDYYYDKEEWSSAIVEYTRILELDVDDDWFRSQALIKVGDCLKRLGQYQEALELYDKVLSRRQSRSFRFTATYERALVLIELERYEDALETLEDLLRDSAFMDQFPKIELAAAICERKMGRTEDAQERFQNLLEEETRGEIAAEGQYELGLLYWHQKHDLANATLSFKEANSASRSSIYAEQADSMLARIGKLSKFWQDIQFYHEKIELTDSVQIGLREMFPPDTTYIDSVEILMEEDRGRDRRRGRSRRDDPMYRMIEEAKREQELEEAAADSAKNAKPDSLVALDSTTVSNYQQSLVERLSFTQLNIGNYYLFQPEFRDSAAYYYNQVLAEGKVDSVWGEAMTSLAFIAKTRKDTARFSEILSEILEKMPEGTYAQKARLAKGMETQEAEVDSLRMKLNRAELLWLEEKNSEAARDLYLQIASEADSASDYRARALLAAARISVRELGQDSAAYDAYEIVKEEYKRTDYANTARDLQGRLTPSFDPDAEDQQPDSLNVEEMPEDSLGGIDVVPPKPLDPIEEELREYEEFDYKKIGEEVDIDRVYTADEVDILPSMTTSKGILRNLLQTFYPRDLIGQGKKGEVLLEFVVDSSGEAREITVVREEPEGEEFGEAAINVMKNLKYDPGRYKGRYVNTRIRQNLVFNPM